ncbi:hypothetical protein GCM10010195_43550 [Kitasatospora griseola]|nr:hypothetical protein GCM10010195_43550 [Kitasatospora griseola]
MLLRALRPASNAVEPAERTSRRTPGQGFWDGSVIRSIQVTVPSAFGVATC